ncbi:hypothetical protein [Oceanicola sp. S124]|uniref:hypothetical protein n=1 Tax=Oceanicola sp. S124 TaxID=1042378 RepID=UPI00110FCAD0|nr:hypothetical protein [Oceanicola sp. S124]
MAVFEFDLVNRIATASSGASHPIEIAQDGTIHWVAPKPVEGDLQAICEAFAAAGREVPAAIRGLLPPADRRSHRKGNSPASQAHPGAASNAVEASPGSRVSKAHLEGGFQ